MTNILHKRRHGIAGLIARAIPILSAAMVLAAPVQSRAAEAGALNINYHCSGTQIDGAEFTVIKAASASDSGYTLVTPFDAADVDPDSITQDNAQDAAKTLSSLYKEGGTVVKTDGNGKAVMTPDEAGLYLVMQTGRTGGSEKFYKAGPMLVYTGSDPVTIEPKTSKVPASKTTTEEDDDDDDDDESSSSSTSKSGGYGSIAVYKVDADDQNTYLEGAEFSLYKSNGDKVGTYTTDRNGYFGVQSLSYSTYYLVEDKAPEGYIGGTDRISFTLNATTSFSNAYPWNIKVTNTKAEPSEVKTTAVTGGRTGDASNLPAMIGAAAMAAGVVVLIVYKKRKAS